MAAVRVQNYLKKHKIGPLFESLMARVIQDTPDDPIDYIINILQDIHKKQSKQLENSYNGHFSPRPSSSHSTRSEKKGKERRPHHLAASWSAGLAQQETKKHENQLRTWTGNDFLSVKNKTWSSKNHSDEKPSQPPWNNDTRVPTHDFDELFQMQNGDETHIKTSQKQTPEKYHGVRSWESYEKQSQVEGKIMFEPDNSDELSQDLQLGSRLSTNQDLVSPNTLGSRSVRSNKQAVEKHRKELQALLLEDRNPRHKKSGVGKHSPEDRGTDVLEKMEDLQHEGVNTSQPLTGAKHDRSKGKKEVSVTICARCARIIGENDDSDNVSQVTSSDFNSGVFDDITKKSQDFDSIDTASEMSENMTAFRGNRGWPISDSEYESTPRNNTVSFNTSKNFNGFPREEAKSIFKSSDELEDDSPAQTQRSSRSRRSDFDFTNMTRSGGWRFDENGSDNESEYLERRKQRSSRSQASGSMKGRAWNTNSGNISDDDSTVT